MIDMDFVGHCLRFSGIEHDFAFFKTETEC